MPPKRKTYIKNCTGGDCEVEKKKSHNLFLRISFYVLSFVFACTSFYMLFFSPQMQITKVEINGTKDLNSNEIQQLIESELQGKVLGFLKKNNYILTSGNKLGKVLTDRYKKIRSVEINKKFPDTIEVKIDERDSLLVWCKNESDCYLLDEDGVAYNGADFSSPELTQNKLLTITDRSDSEVILGSKILEKRYEEYLLNIKNELGKLNVNVGDKFFTPSRMAEEIEAQTDEGFRILLSTQFTLDSAMKTFTAVLKKEIPKDRISQLEYVDLRSEYKIFYKYKNAEENKTAEEPNKEIENK